MPTDQSGTIGYGMLIDSQTDAELHPLWDEPGVAIQPWSKDDNAP